SCQSTYIQNVGKGRQIDSRLVGVWYGQEQGQQIEGVSKKWEMYRNNDATFSIVFEALYEGDTIRSTETGNWWIKGNKFYEYHKESEKKDVYTYKVLNNDQVKFRSFKMAYPVAAGEYEFTDTRKKTGK